MCRIRDRRGEAEDSIRCNNRAAKSTAEHALDQSNKRRRKASIFALPQLTSRTEHVAPGRLVSATNV